MLEVLQEDDEVCATISASLSLFISVSVSAVSLSFFMRGTVSSRFQRQMNRVTRVCTMYNKLTAMCDGVSQLSRLVHSFLHSCAQFDLAGSARMEVLISVIEPRQASQIVKELSGLLPFEEAKVSGPTPTLTTLIPNV